MSNEIENKARALYDEMVSVIADISEEEYVRYDKLWCALVELFD